MNAIVKNLKIKKPSAAEGLSYDNFVLHYLFRQISVYINGKLVSSSNNLSNYPIYKQFMLMPPVSSTLLNGLTIGYEFGLDLGYYFLTPNLVMDLILKINNEK